jgi:hypothetical protein
MALVFDDLASQAVADGELERAARIRGAARRLTGETGAQLASFVDEQFEAHLRPAIYRALDPETLQQLMAEGESMSLDDAIAYALGGNGAHEAVPASSAEVRG